MKKTISLAAVLVMVATAACAEVSTYPMALVNVDYDSWLNVRQSPGGELTLVTLHQRQDVIIIRQSGGWALINTPERHEKGLAPFGWSSMEYLVVYRNYIQIEQENGPCANTTRLLHP